MNYTYWANISSLSRNASAFILIILLFTPIFAFNTSRKEKRQIFREQVLPSRGGKIPESAFKSDRLNLNKLNKDGYSFPDGVLINHRRNQRHPYPYQFLPEVLKVYLTDDGRFVSVFGKFLTKHPESIDTTYTIRSPVKLSSNNLNYLYNHMVGVSAKQVFTPILIPLVLPNHALFEQPMKSRDHPDRRGNNLYSYGAESYQRPRYNSNGVMQTSSNVFDTMLFTPEVFSQRNQFFRGMMQNTQNSHWKGNYEPKNSSRFHTSKEVPSNNRQFKN